MLKIVVAGKTDAGKSTLIGRLLYDTKSLHNTEISAISKLDKINGKALEFAYLLDSLNEERQGQLTIDTTQVFCRAGGLEFLFIDVPGHAELLKNMLCGSSYAQAAVLVVDVTMPIDSDVARHINVLNFLGIKQIVVVFNKLDSTGFNENVFEHKKKEVLRLAGSINIKLRYFIPVSARQGDNLVRKSSHTHWYKGPCLIKALSLISRSDKKERGRGFYFPIQDVYIRKNRSVFVGTILSGIIRKNDTVYISNDHKINKIKAINVFDKNKTSARATESIGLELASPNGLNRGQVIYKNDTLEPTTEISAKILCVKPINIGDSLIFNCVTQQAFCNIKKAWHYYEKAKGADSSKSFLNDGDIAEVSIVIKEPVVVKKFYELEAMGRFVLKKDREICAAGVIT